MRTKQAFKNALMSLLLQLVLALSGFIIPRFFITLYGSPVNGLVSSISQFISYMGLVEAGIGAAGTVALYRPIADHNIKEINGIISAARNFYMRSGSIFALLVAGLTFFYPFVVKNEIQDTSFIRIMVLVLSVNGLVDYFYLGKYRVLLMAHQRGYVISFVQIVGTVVMTAVCIGLMAAESSALLVKAVAAVIYLLRSLAVGIYVKRYYPQANFREEPDRGAFNQRWAALLHQIVGMIVNNTGIILLTIFIPNDSLAEVSVYSVYNLVGYSLSGMMTSISNGLSSGFGEIISTGEKQVLRRSFSSYEFVFFLIIFIVYTCMGGLLYPFIGLYSASFTDGIVYLRWPLVFLFTLAGLLQALRLPGLTVICAAGHYKQTQGRAIIEAGINLVVSLILVRPLGVVGVLIGTCLSYLYRTLDVIIYSAKYFTSGTLMLSWWRIIRNFVLLAILTALGVLIIPTDSISWGTWLLSAVVYGGIVLGAFVVVNFVCESQEFRLLLERVKGIIAK
ncbi:MAG: lipopolysaccharide biosynthesis protein [Acutalibacteraceae bacterium]